LFRCGWRKKLLRKTQILFCILGSIASNGGETWKSLEIGVPSIERHCDDIAQLR
jgi:hypothetical protein